MLESKPKLIPYNLAPVRRSYMWAPDSSLDVKVKYDAPWWFTRPDVRAELLDRGVRHPLAHDDQTTYCWVPQSFGGLGTWR